MSLSADQTACTALAPASEDVGGAGVEQVERVAAMKVPWMATWVGLLSFSAMMTSLLVFWTQGRQGFFLPVLAGVVCVLAALLDARTGRIPNPLTYTAIVLGLGLNGLLPLLQMMNAPSAITWLAAAGPSASLWGFAACAGLGFLATLTAGVHGGDLKLLAAVGSLLGLAQTGNVLMVALAVAIVYSLINLALVGRLNTVVRIASARLLEAIYLRRFVTELPEDAPGAAAQIPMAVPLAIGLVVAQCWAWRAGGGGFL